MSSKKKIVQQQTYYYLFLWHVYNKDTKRNEDRYALVESNDDFKTMFSLEIKINFVVWNTILTNKQFNILTTCNSDITDLYNKYPNLKKFTYSYFDEDIKKNNINVICIDMRKLKTDCKGNEIKHLYQREYAYVKFVGDKYIDGKLQEIEYTKAYLFGTYAYMFYIKSKCYKLFTKEDINTSIFNDIKQLNEYIKTISKENFDELVNDSKNIYNNIIQKYDILHKFIKIDLPTKQNVLDAYEYIKSLKKDIITLYEFKNKITEIGKNIEQKRLIK